MLTSKGACTARSACLLGVAPHTRAKAVRNTSFDWKGPLVVFARVWQWLAWVADGAPPLTACCMREVVQRACALSACPHRCVWSCKQEQSLCVHCFCVRVSLSYGGTTTFSAGMAAPACCIRIITNALHVGSSHCHCCAFCKRVVVVAGAHTGRVIRRCVPSHALLTVCLCPPLLCFAATTRSRQYCRGAREPRCGTSTARSTLTSCRRTLR